LAAIPLSLAASQLYSSALRFNLVVRILRLWSFNHFQISPCSVASHRENPRRSGTRPSARVVGIGAAKENTPPNHCFFLFPAEIVNVFPWATVGVIGAPCPELATRVAIYRHLLVEDFQPNARIEAACVFVTPSLSFRFRSQSSISLFSDDTSGFNVSLLEELSAT